MLSLDTKSGVSLRRILWTTDFLPPSEASLLYATALARRHGAKLYAAHVINPRTDLFVRGVPITHLSTAEKEADRNLSERLHPCRLMGVVPERVVGLGETTRVLANMVQDFDIDLTVLGTHGRKGVEKAFMGSVAEEIIRSSCSPVLTVGPGVGVGALDPAGLKHIVCATDFSSESISAVQIAIAWAQDHSASLTLLHVVEGCAASELDEHSRLERISKQQLEHLITAEAWGSCRIRLRIGFGPPAEWILRVAEQCAADLIVEGARRIGVLGGRLPRGTIYKVLREANCPVLTVTDGFNSSDQTLQPMLA